MYPLLLKILRKGRLPEKAFPDLSTTILHMCVGIEKYAQKSYYRFDPTYPNAVHNHIKYVGAGTCALMDAMWAPRECYLNTPDVPYGWDFGETRALLGAIDGIASVNFSYWSDYMQIYRGVEFPVDVATLTNPTPTHLRPLTWASWPLNLPFYRQYAEKLKTIGL